MFGLIRSVRQDWRQWEPGLVDKLSMQIRMRSHMPSGPVFASTGRQMEELKRLARDLGTTVGEAVAIAA